MYKLSTLTATNLIIDISLFGASILHLHVMKPSILILYYSQTGQLRSILDSLFSEQQTACDIGSYHVFLAASFV